MEKGFQYCPVCGTKADTAPKTDSKNNGSADQPLTQKKPMPLWFKIISVLFVVALIVVTGGILFTESLVDVVDHHLESLVNDDIEKAYTYTSKEFQAKTNLDEFRQFIQSYPVFHNNKTSHFSKRSWKNNIVVLKGNITSNDRVNTPIEYKLTKEGDKWKILSIRLIKPDLIPHAPKDIGTTNELIEVATDLLTRIRSGKSAEAYKMYSSKEFMEATPEGDFIEFINRYPILEKYQTITFPKAVVRNGVGSLGAILRDDEVEAYVKYYFIIEDQQWKILSMRILSRAEESIEEPIAFGDLVLGSEIDENGVILNTQESFDSNLKDLYINLDIENGLKGEAVNLLLQHLESGSSIPAKVVIAENGDTMLLSTFSPPTQGWLKGDYRVVASTSSGLSKTIDFSIK